MDLMAYSLIHTLIPHTLIPNVSHSVTTDGLGRNFAEQSKPANMGVRVSLIYRPINKGEIQFPITPRHTGAIAEFYEVIREIHDGQRVRGMDLTAVGATQERMQQIGDRLHREQGLSDFECIQRLGFIPVGEAALCVRSAAPEQAQAFAAIQQFLDEVRAMSMVEWRPAT